MKRAVWLAVLLFLPVAATATTGTDLSGRVSVDGAIGDYEPDEWVLGPDTPFPERRADSRWGRDSDVARIAVTWDSRHLYIAIDGVVARHTVIGLLDAGPGGVSDLSALGPLRRNIILTAMSANAVFTASAAAPEADLFVAGAGGDLERVDPGAFASRFVQSRGGPLEIALPWTDVFPPGGAIDLVVAVTAGTGTGAGDAAPDPSGVLTNDPYHRAYLDNAVRITVDSDGDGRPDAGVSPSAVTTTVRAAGAVAREGRPFDVAVERRVVAPDDGDTVRFRVALDADQEPASIFLTARVFDTAGRLVRVLYRNESRALAPGVPGDWDEWDLADSAGRQVPAGMYVIGVTGGASLGAETRSARAAVSVVR